MTEKKCTECGEIKSLSEFHKDKKTRDGHKYKCKSCVKKYQQNNKERIAEYQSKWYYKNTEHSSKQKANYYQTNRDRIIERQAEYDHKNKYKREEYYQENRDNILERVKKYQKQNPEVYRAIRAKRRAIKKSTSTTDPWELQEIAGFYKNRPEGYHVDHIIPLNLGGAHELANLQYLENQLNLNKHAKHPDDWDDPRPISCRA